MCNIYWGTKVWNIDINFVVIKKQIKNRYKDTCLVKFEVLGSQNTQKILSHDHIRSTDQFKQVGVREKICFKDNKFSVNIPNF